MSQRDLSSVFNTACRARGRIRTCGLPLRRRLLYPLSYAGLALSSGDVCRILIVGARHRSSTK